MASDANSEKFIESLSTFTREHQAKQWRGTFAEFVRDIVGPQSRLVTRSSHQYVWDMLRWMQRREQKESDDKDRKSVV